MPPVGPAFGGLLTESARGRPRNLPIGCGIVRATFAAGRRSAASRAIGLYERDVPDVPLVVDRYEDALHIAEFARPHDRSPAQHADWLDLMARTAAKCWKCRATGCFSSIATGSAGPISTSASTSAQARFVVHEGGLKFVVNLSDYVDTGLFLDHRITRQMVREAAAGSGF